jgi:phage baseplate assembly protein V
MTTFNQFTDRNRDQQDGFERHIWGKLEYLNGAGAILSVKGTDTEDFEAPIMNFGYGFNVPQDYNTEVFLVSHGSDTNQKYAIPTIPRDKQRQWPEGTGGVQHPTNADKFVQLDDDQIWLKDGVFKVGNEKEVTITVSGGKATIEVNEIALVAPTITLDGNVQVTGDLTIDGSLTNQGVDVGSQHAHTGVTAGAANTGAPVV